MTVSIVLTVTALYAIFVGRKCTKISGRKGVKTMAKNEIQKRLKIIEKVIALGFKTEDDIKKILPNDLIKDNSLTFADILLIYDLQESVKNNKLFSFISTGSNEVV